MKFWAKNILALLLGLGSCAGSAYYGKSSMKKLSTWERVNANVTGSVNRKDISYSYNGQSYSFTTVNAKDVIGSATVIFPKEDPSKGEILDYKTLLVLPLIIAVVGLGFTAAGFFSIKSKLSGITPPDPNDLSDPRIQAKREFLEQVKEKAQKLKDFKNGLN